MSKNLLSCLLGCMLGCMVGVVPSQAQQMAPDAKAPEFAPSSHGRDRHQRSISFPVSQTSAGRLSLKSAAGKNVTVCGNVIDAMSWYEDGGIAHPAIWSVPLATPSVETVIAEGPNGNYGAVAMKDQYLTITYNKSTYTANYTIYDMTEWMVIKEGKLDMPFETIDMAYDASTDKVYAVFCDVRGYYSFGTLDTDYMWNMPLATLSAPWWGLAVDDDGQLYAIDGSGDLLKVDKTNGSVTKLFSTGITSRIKGGAVIIDDTFYYEYVGPSSSVFYAISLTDGSTTQVGTVPDGAELVGLYVPEVQLAPEAPAAASSFTGDFKANMLSGSIRFTAPTVNCGGDALTGQLSYVVIMNGEEFATGNVSAGAEVTLPVSVDKAGIYLFEVYCSQGDVDGAVKKLRQFIGPDTPTAPTAVNAMYADGVMHVTWSPPAIGVDGGTLDPDEVTYTVRQFTSDNPDGKVIAAGQQAYRLDVRMAAPENLTTYWYEVTAVNLDRLESAPGVSPRVILGNIIPPYFQNFKDETSFDGFTVINANNDNVTWTWGADHAQYSMAYTQGDDWLITNPIALKKGEAYDVSMRVGCGSIFIVPERIEVAMGTTPTVDGMTGDSSELIIAPYDIIEVMSWGVGGEIIRGRFTPPADGIYYLGMHCISPAFKGWLYLTDLTISQGISVQAPEAVTGLEATPDQDGELVATVNFKSPTEDVAGNNLSSIDLITVLRDGEVVKTFNPATVGMDYTFVDRHAPYGTSTYTVVCSNASGNGPSSECDVFVGYTIPRDVQAITAKRGANDGEVQLEWTPVVEDCNGLPFAPGKVTYTLIRADMSGQQTIVAENITETSFTDQAVEADADQRFVFYGVFAIDDAGNAQNPAMTDYMSVGKSYVTPFVESFANGAVSHPTIANSDWTTGQDASFTQFTSFDGDNGYLVCESPAVGSQSTIYFGNVLISGSHPVLSFRRFCMSGGSNTIKVIVNDGSGWDILGLVGTESTGDRQDAWRVFQLSLDEYIGQNIMIGFTVECETFRYTFIDAVAIDDAPAVEIGQVEISAPAVMEGVFDVPLEVSFANFGYDKATGVKVSVYRDGELVEELQTSDVNPLGNGSLKLTDHLTPLTEPVVTYYAEVTCTGDAETANNVSGEIEVNVQMPEYPVVNDLEALRQDDGVHLSWSAPAVDRAPLDVTEDFESYPMYAVDKVGKWTFIDRDELAAGNIDGVDFPYAGEEISFFVMDGSGSEFNDSFAAHSGNKYMCSIYGTYWGWGSQSDDWMITPRLSGNAQTIKFWARSYSPDDLETFEMLYSTAGLDTDDFQLLDTKNDIDAEWTEYTVDLPEGARYFAIRARSYDKFMLFIDDVTMQLESPFVDLWLQGYQLFRDGNLIAELGTDATSYSDMAADLHSHAYHLSAIYNQGASAPSNKAVVEDTGIYGPSMATAAIKGGIGQITVENACGQQIAVIGVDGRVLNTVTVNSAVANIPAAPGVYVVKAGSMIEKVIVR